jgi:hypothetical protein
MAFRQNWCSKCGVDEIAVGEIDIDEESWHGTGTSFGQSLKN